MSKKLKEFPIYIQHDRYSDRSVKRAHRQPGTEIHLTHSGEAAFILRGAIVKQAPRQVLLIREQVPHQIFVHPESNFSRTVICADSRSRGDSLLRLADCGWLPEGEWASFVLPPPAYADLIGIVESMTEEARRCLPGWERKMLSLFLDLTVLLQRASGGFGEGGEPERQPSVPQLISSCIHYIHAHLHEDLSLNRLASKFGVSPEYLTRSFRKEIHISYYQYVLLQRILRAKELIANDPNLQLTEAALATGFSSSSHFSRVFKEFAGESPASYRKRSRNANAVNK